jgi:cytochrome c5
LDAGWRFGHLVKLFILSVSSRQVETEKGNTMSEELKDSDVMKMLLIVVGALIGFFVLIIIIAQLVSGPSTKMGVDKMVEAATIERIKPFGESNIGAVPVAAASSAVDGKGTYISACFACHGTGAAGAPKVGDKAAWKKRIAQGMSTLNDHAINGFKGMPAKGGNGSLSDAAVEAAVEYMVKGSK